MEGIGENSDPNESEVKPDVNTLKVGFNDLVSDLATVDEDLRPAVLDAHKAKVNSGGTTPADEVAVAEDQNVPDMDTPDNEEGTDDDDDGGGGEAEGEFEAESGAGVDVEEDIDTAPDNVEKVILQPMVTVVLPDEKTAAMCYLEKAMLGFSCFLEDMSFDCTKFAAKMLNAKPCDPHWSRK